MAVYYASKAYVVSFSEALAEELIGSGITVTCLCPGYTATEFQKAAGIQKTGMLARLRPMPAATVARIGYRGLMAGRRLVVPGWGNRISVFGLRFSPRWFTVGAASWLEAALSDVNDGPDAGLARVTRCRRRCRPESARRRPGTLP
jgi:short-subunit dehydrogenase